MLDFQTYKTLHSFVFNLEKREKDLKVHLTLSNYTLSDSSTSNRKLCN